MVEEFDALGVSFKERGTMADEQLEVVHRLWNDEKPRFDGRYYHFDEVGFSPKPLQKPRVPIWIGGGGARAQRRARTHGDAWVPYFVRIKPRELAAGLDHLPRRAVGGKRHPQAVRV